MKVRSGFVSNSSTSSFIVLVKPDKVKDVDFIIRHAMRDYNTPCATVPERKKELRKEIRELDKDTIYTENLMAQLEVLFTDEAYDFHMLCEKINLVAGGGAWRQARYGIRNYRMYPSPYEPERDRHFTRLNETLQNIAIERASCERELEQITGNEKWSIISFEEDANWGHLDRMIDELVADGDAIVLHKETT